MGACTSKQSDGTDVVHGKQLNQQSNDQSEKDKIAKQRRKLSVAPQHVGDINSRPLSSTTNTNGVQPLPSHQYTGARKGSIVATGDTTLTAAAAAAAAAAANQPQQPNGHASPQHQLDSDELMYTGSALSPADMTAQAAARLSHGTRSKKGLVPYNRNKVNQDRGFIKYALGPNRDIGAFGVMDGHGEFGHLVASFVQERLPLALDATGSMLQSDTGAAIQTAVKSVVNDLRDSSINAAFSGTTCVFGVLVGRTLYVANIGDSRCVLGRLINGRITPVQLTNDQKPEVPAEKARILAAGGRVEPLPGPPGEDCGPPRVWLAEVDVPGLAMSRSIGDDVSQTVGVTSIPEITVHHIDEATDLFAVWASDGVWEFMQNESVVQLVHGRMHDLYAAATAVVDESTKQWRSQEEVIDDITAIVLQLKPSLGVV